MSVRPKSIDSIIARQICLTVKGKSLHRNTRKLLPCQQLEIVDLIDLNEVLLKEYKSISKKNQ